MSDNIFWDKNLDSDEIKNILRDEASPKFIDYSATLLSRTNNAKEVFGNYLDKTTFCQNWQKIKRKMRKNKWADKRIIYWDELYKVILPLADVRSVKEQQNDIIPELKKICNIIGETRRNKNITQKDLAKKLGVSQQLISYIENGKANFTIETLNIVLDALGLSISIVSKKKIPTDRVWSGAINATYEFQDNKKTKSQK